MEKHREDKNVEVFTDFLLSKADVRRPLKIVADCSNGPAGLVIGSLARKIAPKAKIGPINDLIDPDFRAHGPDPSDVKALSQAADAVRKTGADFGVVFDGDGDRAVFVDETGQAIPSFAIAGFLAENISGMHVADTLVYEALVHIDPEFRDKLIRSKVGRYFLNISMREKGGVVGSEFSGHFYFRDFFGADSAELTLVFVMSFLSWSDKKASEAFKKYTDYAVAVEKAEIEADFDSLLLDIKAKLSEDGALSAYNSDGVTADFGNSWISIRPSNTEPIVRVTAGAETTEKARELAERYAGFLKDETGIENSGRSTYRATEYRA